MNMNQLLSHIVILMLHGRYCTVKQWIYTRRHFNLIILHTIVSAVYNHQHNSFRHNTMKQHQAQCPYYLLMMLFIGYVEQKSVG